MAAQKKVDLKVVMLGRQSVGKSALVDRFANDRWTPNGASTIGGSFCAKEVVTEAAVGKSPAKTVTLGVWDTAGSERYESLTRHYFAGSEAALICFDLTDHASWLRVAHWIDELHKVEPNCRVYVLGCKADLIAINQGTQAAGRARGSVHSNQQRSRCVPKEEIEAFCAEVQPQAALYFETSALTGAGALAPFVQVCKDWQAKPKAEVYRGASVSLDEPGERRKKGPCCNQ